MPALTNRHVAPASRDLTPARRARELGAAGSGLDPIARPASAGGMSGQARWGAAGEGARAARRRRENPKERQAGAGGLAVAALGFIAAEPERLGRFLALSGIGPDSIRAAAREPQFLAGVLDHITS